MLKTPKLCASPFLGYDPVTMSCRRHLRAISWIAIVAIAASVLAPLAARAMAAWPAPGSPWDEICTSLGLKPAAAYFAERGSEAPAKPGGMPASGECPYCLPSATPTALPSQGAGVPPSVEQRTARLLFFFISSTASISAPDSIRPRAPPRIS